MDELIERFYSKIQPQSDSDCWIWGAFKGKNGYGQFGFQGKIISVHRFSYMLHNGEIPNGLLVRHTCDNKQCVNPEHLLLGTAQDNSNDMKQRNRQSRLQGEINGLSRLTEEQVRMIRTSVGKSQRELAREFGVNDSAISKIINNKLWRHIV